MVVYIVFIFYSETLRVWYISVYWVQYNLPRNGVNVEKKLYSSKIISLAGHMFSFTDGLVARVQGEKAKSQLPELHPSVGLKCFYCI